MTRAGAAPLVAPLLDRLKAESAGDPKELREARDTALDRYLELGPPDPRGEAWRFTDLRALLEGELELADRRASVSAATSAAIRERLSDLGGVPRLVFLNGCFCPGLSDLARLPGDVRATPLSQADHERLASALGRCVVDPNEQRGFLALNTAVLQDGAYVRFPAGAGHSTVALVHVADCGERPIQSHPRTVVVCERGSRATLVEVYLALGEGSLTNAVSELHLEEGSDLRVRQVHEPGARARRLVAHHVVQEARSRLELLSVQRGGRVFRNEVRVELQGDGAACQLRGVTLTLGEEQVGNHTHVEHASPGATSRQEYRGAAAGSSRLVFDGQILVREGAHKTAAEQLSRNLLLSDDAQVQTNPRLRIHADDVRCTHGANVGRLDPEALFYVRARGVPEGRARELLVRAFLAGLLDSAEDTLRPRLDALLGAGLSQLHGSG